MVKWGESLAPIVQFWCRGPKRRLIVNWLKYIEIYEKNGSLRAHNSIDCLTLEVLLGFKNAVVIENQHMCRDKTMSLHIVGLVVDLDYIFDD